MQKLSIIAFGAALVGSCLLAAGTRPGEERLTEAQPTARGPLEAPPEQSSSRSPATLDAVVQQYCVVCHNDAALTGNLSLQHFEVATAPQTPQVAEKMIRKLRAQMMPPPGMPRPGGDTLGILVETLERTMDQAAASAPNPGRRSFQRLNRAEYQRSIRDLLGLEIDAGAFLPLDTKSDNFDNIADVQLLSPTLLSGYLNAAAEVSRLALGDPGAAPAEHTYTLSSYVSQMEQIEGAPFGTRGGASVVHNFPADGWYKFTMTFAQTATGEGFFGQTARLEQIEVSINGERAAVLAVDQWMRITDGPRGISLTTDSVFVKAGPHRVAAAFLKRFEGPVPDLMAPHEWSLADRDIGIDGYGLTMLPHLKDLSVAGPTGVTGVSDTPSRDRILTCRPASPAEERPCAEQILSGLATEAYRRPLSAQDREGVMALYDAFREESFETRIRRGLQGILASPHFVFRIERAPEDVEPGENYRVSDADIAARLSFFIWGAAPDTELKALAERGRLSDGRVLEQQVRRMLADPRSEALATRFAAQWLRLQDLEKVNPDQFWFPNYDQQLATYMRRETEAFFHNLVVEDGSLLDLYSADYTFINERLARHYGIAGVVGPEFRKVTYPDASRRGILGHGSVLVLTSHANRTSPVLRGKWVMEVLLGTPPPPPPPGVPDLEETQGARDGRFLTTRERMEQHRASQQCRSCHMFMDPIGLALDNFDVTGRWRIRENGMPLDTRGELYDGTPVSTPQDLQQALLKRPVPLVRTFTENLMAYGLGRRVDWFDAPTVRAITREAEKDDYRLSSLILGVVRSEAFQMKRAGALMGQPTGGN